MYIFRFRFFFGKMCDFCKLHFFRILEHNVHTYYLAIFRCIPKFIKALKFSIQEKSQKKGCLHFAATKKLMWRFLLRTFFNSMIHNSICIVCMISDGTGTRRSAMEKWVSCKLNKSFLFIFHQIFGIFEYFSSKAQQRRWEIWNIIKYSKDLCQKWRKSLFNPFFCWFQGYENSILSNRSITTYLYCMMH